jgi:hypothetical protein
LGGASIALAVATAYDLARAPRSPRPKGESMKKLLIILIVAAIGIAVAKKVRDA